jgi:ElaB/YqjD/DUF883 family membrane-anchored ribosome-binding protein
MAEPLRRTPDTPNFDTYPAPTPSAERILPAGNPGDERLNEAAEQIGATVGKAVRVVRQVPEQIGTLKDRFTVIRGRGQDAATEKARELKDIAGEKARELRDAAGEKARELRDAAGQRALELRRAAGEQLYRARRRVDYVASEYPLQVILGAAGVAFLLGVGLRVWRSNRG